jgi:hypothetical protein
MKDRLKPRALTVDEQDAFNAARRKIKESLSLLAHVLEHADNENPIEENEDLHNSLIELAVSSLDEMVKLDEIVQRAYKGGVR